MKYNYFLMEDPFNLKMNLTKALQNIEIILRPPPLPPFEQFLKDIRFCHGPRRRLKAMALAPPCRLGVGSNEQTRTDMSALACRLKPTCVQVIVTVCNSNRHI